MKIGVARRALDLHDVVLVGHSMGGIAAMSLMTLAADAGAERVGALVLVATIAHTQSPDRRFAIHVGNTRPYEELAGHPRHAAALARFVFGRIPNRALVDAALASNARCPRDSRTGAALGLVDYDIRDRLDEIRIPTVVVCGDRDLLTPLRDNKDIAQTIGAELIVAADAGHLVIWEQAALVADAVASMVAQAAPSSA